MKPLLKKLVIAIASLAFVGVLSFIKIQSPITLGQYNPSGGGTYRLQSSIGLSATTIKLSSFTEPISGIPYTMAYLASSIAYGTLDPQTSNRSEFVSFTGITQNSDGTATLTGLTRGLSRTPGSGGCVASTTLTQSHSGQSIFILSNSPCFYSEYAVKKNDETITGYWTVPIPLSNGNPATKSYVDSLVNGGTVSNAQVVVAGTAGETVSAGQTLYLKQVDGRWYRASVSTPEASTTPIALAQGAGTSGNPITGGVLLEGLDSNQSGLSVGVPYFVGPIAGTVSSATSTRVLGRARTNTSLYFHPDYLIQNLPYTPFTMQASTTFNSFLNLSGATTTFNNAATSSVVVTATSSLQIGSFPAYWIGKNMIATTTSGNFQVPAGITKIYVRMVGGGGGGGKTTATTNAGAGAGAGGYGEKMVNISATTSIQFTIGAAGTGSTGSGGVTGGTTYFGPSNNAFFSCTGGIGAADNVGGIQGDGGTCTNADVTTPGGAGETSISVAGSTFGGTGMHGGSSYFGSYGAYGSGGRGGLNTNGSSGIQGYMIISW